MTVDVSLSGVPEDPNPFGRELFGQEHVRVYQRTGGEQGYEWRGTTILLLTTTGRASGVEHTTPLIYGAEGDRCVVVASKGGSPDHPDWYKNLEAHPDAMIQVKHDQILVRASTARDAERARLWEMMTGIWPAYDDYQLKTDREIPVVVLERR